MKWINAVRGWKHRATAAFVILALAVGFEMVRLQEQAENARENREAIARAVMRIDREAEARERASRNALIEACDRANEIRRTMTDALEAQIESARNNPDRTRRDRRRAVRDIRDIQAAFQQVDCEATTRELDDDR